MSALALLAYAFIFISMQVVVLIRRAQVVHARKGLVPYVGRHRKQLNSGGTE